VGCEAALDDVDVGEVIGFDFVFYWVRASRDADDDVGEILGQGLEVLVLRLVVMV
jgi:hypothetical protein